MLGTPSQSPGWKPQVLSPKASLQHDLAWRTSLRQRHTRKVFILCCGDSGLGCLLHGGAHYVAGVQSLPVACSRAFKAHAPNEQWRYTAIFAKWIPSIVGKDKGPSLQDSFGLGCSCFACHCQETDSWILTTLAVTEARGWESQTRIWFTEWIEVPEVLRCG